MAGKNKKLKKLHEEHDYLNKKIDYMTEVQKVKRY